MIEEITMPVISTAHLDEKTAKALLESGVKPNPWCPCASWQYGHFIYLGETDMDETDPQCLRDIQAWLEDNGHEGWVRLDRDGDLVTGLRTYDW